MGNTDALDVLCAQLTRDLFAIAKFLFIFREVLFEHFFDMCVPLLQSDCTINHQSQQLINVIRIISKV